MQPLQANLEKFVSGPRNQRRCSVWVGHADFSKIDQRKQKFIRHVSCVFI